MCCNNQTNYNFHHYDDYCYYYNYHYYYPYYYHHHNYYYHYDDDGWSRVRLSCWHSNQCGTPARHGDWYWNHWRARGNRRSPATNKQSYARQLNLQWNRRRRRVWWWRGFLKGPVFNPDCEPQPVIYLCTNVFSSKAKIQSIAGNDNAEA